MRESITHNSRGAVAMSRNRMIGSGKPFRWPWLTTGFEPTKTVIVHRSWSTTGTKPVCPDISVDTSGLQGVSILIAEYFEREPIPATKRSAAHFPAPSKDAAVPM